MSSFAPSFSRAPARLHPVGRAGGFGPSPRSPRRRHASRPAFRVAAERPWFRRVAGSLPAPAGLEWRFLSHLPCLAVLVTVLPLAPAAFATLFDPSPEFMGRLLGWGVHGVVTLWVALAVCAVSAVIVYLMKGPAYEADSYWTDGTHRR
jgi:hypothetical protein